MDAALRVLRQLEAAPDAGKQAASPANAAPPTAITNQPAMAAPPAATATDTDANASNLLLLRQLEAAQETAKKAAAAGPTTPLPAVAAPPAPAAPTAPPAPAAAALDNEKARREFLAAKKAALLAEQKRQNEAKQKALQEEIAARLTQAQEAKKAARTNSSPTPSDTVTAPPPLDATMAQQQAALQNATGQNTANDSRNSQANMILAQPPAAGEPSPASAAAANANGPATREEKLADLLRQWRDGEITPLQYHTRRALIIAGP
ncbi:MAG: hypothetical protein ABSF38_18120 [Verrucomicrobiota bacterium]|jgi:hypothetical protein